MPIRPFRVGRSKSGLGLFATKPIKKRTRLAEYKGRRLTNAEAEEKEKRYANRYMFEVNSRWTVDGWNKRNIAKYFNHSCRPNAEADVVRGKIIIRSIRNIKPGDEITYNYGKDYFEAFIKPIGCRCPKCVEKRREERAAARRRRARAKAREEKARQAERARRRAAKARNMTRGMAHKANGQRAARQ
jgi:SET domain-containing protein